MAASFRRIWIPLASLVVAYGCAEGDTLTGGGSSNDGAGSQGAGDGDGGGASSSVSTTGSGSQQSSTTTTTSSSSSGGGGGGGPSCGDGVVDTGEDCDGSNLDGATCTSIGQGFTGGALACASDCSFDTSECTAPPNCGNGAIDAGEDCDGGNLNGGTCATEGFSSGTIACGGGCLYDTSQCYTCGNGTVQGPEVCDGANLGGQTCISLGHDGGTLACAANCLSFNQNPCTDCGDGTLEGAEVCDGSNLGGQTCQSQGFSGGTLACNGTCTGFNTANCTNTCTPVNLLATNPGFDSGPNGGGWTESSLNFGTPVCSTAVCGLGGGTGPHSGTYWAWFGGTNAAFETATVSRSVVINPGMATLRFQFDLPSCESPAWAIDQFTVSIDGNILFQTTNLDAQCGQVGWTLQSYDVSAYANGQAHTITFTGTTDDFVNVTNFMLDSVELLGCP